MKKIAILIVLAAGMMLQSCSKHIVSSCIQSKIDQYKNDPDGMIHQVDEYKFQGKLVYVFSDDASKMSDPGANIYDESCNQVCFIGGIGGLTMCNGEKFSEKAVFKRTIWKR